MRRFLLLFLALCLFPLCALSEDAVSSAAFFYTYGIWQNAQAQDTLSAEPVTVSAYGSESLCQLGEISVGTSAEDLVFLVRAELDPSSEDTVSTMVSLCAALSGDTQADSEGMLKYIQFLGQSAQRGASSPSQLGAYEIHVQSDGTAIYYSALLSGYKQDPSVPAPEAAEAPFVCMVSTGGGTLRLRSEMSASSRILAEMPNGTRLTLLEQGEEWCRVQYRNQVGYAMTRFLSITQ